MADDNLSREQALQGDRRPRRWLRTAGVVVLVLFVVSRSSATPNPAWTPITAVLALLVAGLLARDLLRRPGGR